MLKKGLKSSGYTVALLVLGLGVLRFTGFWDNLLSAGENQSIDFATLELSDTPNQYLLCPPGLCKGAQGESPVFERPLSDLRLAFTRLVKSEAGVDTIFESDDGLSFVIRTALVRWPDWVTVQFIDLGANRSTLAIYSRSVYGRSDFGANEQRVTGWLAQLR